jgi:hypothetical protein
LNSDYAFDVFLSYLHERPCGPWVNDHFLPYFSPQLSNALGGRKVSIFYDRTGIHSGEKWPARLKHALAHSRCLVSIWSPQYFHSEWCAYESAIIRHRELELGYGTPERPNGLIVGVKVNDGIHFPAYAKDTHRADFEPYFFDGPGFTLTALHVDFQRAIVPLTIDVARVIQNAPLWSAEWLMPKWTDDVMARVQMPGPSFVAQPLIT